MALRLSSLSLAAQGLALGFHVVPEPETRSDFDHANDWRHADGEPCECSCECREADCVQEWWLKYLAAHPATRGIPDDVVALSA